IHAIFSTSIAPNSARMLCRRSTAKRRPMPTTSTMPNWPVRTDWTARCSADAAAAQALSRLKTGTSSMPVPCRATWPGTETCPSIAPPNERPQKTASISPGATPESASTASTASRPRLATERSGYLPKRTMLAARMNAFSMFAPLDAPVDAGPVALADLAAQDLSVGALGQLVHLLDRARPLVGAHAPATPGEEAFLIEGAVRARDHQRVHLLAPLLAGDADDDGLLHVRMRVQGFLHFPGIDVAAAGDDHLLLAVGDVEEAVLVEPADVAAALPDAVAVGRRRLRVVEVADHLVVARGDDLAFPARREQVALVIHDRDGAEQHRRAGGCEPMLQPLLDRDAVLLLVEVRHELRRLPLAVALDEDRPPLAQRLLEVLDRHRRAAIDHGVQRGLVEAVVLRMLQQHLDHRRRGEGGGHLLLRDQAQRLARIEAWQHDLPRADHEVREAHRAGGMRHWCRMQQDVVIARPAEGPRQVVADDHQPVALAQHDPLGPPRAARGVVDAVPVVLFDPVRRRAGVRGPGQVLVAQRPGRRAVADADVVPQLRQPGPQLHHRRGKRGIEHEGPGAR